LPFHLDSLTEDEKKSFIINNISDLLLAYAAYDYKLESILYLKGYSSRVKKWKEEFLKWTPRKVFENLLPYYMSGQKSTVLYLIEKYSWEHLKKISKNKNELNTSIEKEFSDLFPRIIYLSPEEIAIQFKWALNPKNEFYRENNKLKMRIHTPIKDIWVKIYLKIGIIEIRTKNINEAQAVKHRLCEGFGLELGNISFDEKEVNNLFEWIKLISNSNISFDADQTISSATYTSGYDEKGRRLSLKNVPQFIEARKNGTLVSVYVYVPETDIIDAEIYRPEHKKDDNNELEEIEEEIDIGGIEGTIGFNINFNKGKIFFKRTISEKQITNLVTKIAGTLELDAKRNTLKRPIPQVKLTNWLDMPNIG